jgi:hypothetical protein
VRPEKVLSAAVPVVTVSDAFEAAAVEELESPPPAQEDKSMANKTKQ